MTLFIPNDLLEKLKCITCSNYLSIFPVHLKNDGDKAVCGRCKISYDDEYIRDEAYENLAQFLLFPCAQKTNGCTEQLPPSQLKEHECTCVHRKLDCPTKSYSKCPWQGPIGDVLKHFEGSHASLILKDGQFEINFINSYKENMLMVYEKEIFIVKKEVDSKLALFQCSVEHISKKENAETLNYYLRVETSNKSYVHKFQNKPTAVGDESTTKFTLDFIREKLNDPASILGNIQILKAESSETSELKSKPTEVMKDPNIDWELLEELECPVCFEYMLAPIFQCTNGHSICGDCKPRVTVCPLCKNAINTTQNFSLEKVSQRLKYPCKFHKSGCIYSSKSGEIRKHESFCEYGPYDCPLKEIENCETKSSKSEIVGHIDNNHDDFVLKSDKVNMAFSMDDHVETKCYLIKFTENIFRVIFKFENEKFYWSCQLVGPADECKKFKFEVDIIDNSGNKLRQYMKGLCVPMETRANSFSKRGTYICIAYDQIQDFITESFSYRIRVLKD